MMLKGSRAKTWRQGIKAHGRIKWWVGLLTFPLWAPVYWLANSAMARHGFGMLAILMSFMILDISPDIGFARALLGCLVLAVGFVLVLGSYRRG